MHDYFYLDNYYLYISLTHVKFHILQPEHDVYTLYILFQNSFFNDLILFIYKIR